MQQYLELSKTMTQRYILLLCLPLPLGQYPILDVKGDSPHSETIRGWLEPLPLPSPAPLSKGVNLYESQLLACKMGFLTLTLLSLLKG